MSGWPLPLILLRHGNRVSLGMQAQIIVDALRLELSPGHIQVGCDKNDTNDVDADNT